MVPQPTLLTLLTAASLLLPSSLAAQVEVRADFDGDGFADLAIGASTDTVLGAINAGTVQVFYGSGKGLAQPRSQFLAQPSLGLVAEELDWFGQYLVPGDFNGDGFSDLAITSGGESTTGLRDEGQVHVVFGSKAGLIGASAVHFQATSTGGPYDFGYYGQSVSAADFDQDGYDELVIADARASVGALRFAGAVEVRKGSPSGLLPPVIWNQNSPGIPGTATGSAAFSGEARPGDFNGDGFPDLAIRDQYADVGGVGRAGSVTILFGGAGGLTGAGSQTITAATEAPGAFDFFGTDLDVGDLNGDGADDLLVSLPNRRTAGTKTVGIAEIRYGSSTGTPFTVAHQLRPGVGPFPDYGDRFDFPSKSCVGDFNGDGYGDLVIADAQARRYVNGVAEPWVGGGFILWGSATGADLASPTKISDCGVERGDSYGSALWADDFNADGVDDLIVGVRYEQTPRGNRTFIGAIQVTYGSTSGLGDPRCFGRFVLGIPGGAGAIGRGGIGGVLPYSGVGGN